MAIHPLRQHMSTIKAFSVVITVCFMLTACIQSFNIDVPRYADKSSLMVSEQTLRDINRLFYANFSHGDWSYKGAKATAGEVRAYIKMPYELNMKPQVQKRYVQDVICPKQDNIALWSKLKQIDLSVHLVYRRPDRQRFSNLHQPTR